MRLIMSLSLMASLLVVVFLLGISLTRRERTRAVYFSVICMATALYLFGYCLEVLSPSPDAALIALKVQNAGIPFLGPFSLLCVLCVCRYRFFRPWMGVTAAVYSFLMFLVVLTNDWHLLYYPAISWVPIEDMHYLSLEHGPLYNLQQAVVILCTCGSYAALIGRFLGWPSKACRQLRLIAFGVSVSFLVNLLYFTRTVPHYIDPTPFSMVLSLLCIMIGIVKYRLFDLLPVATETAVENMDCAMVVVDEDWCYRSANRYARQLFPSLERLHETDAVSRVENWPAVLAKAPAEDTADEEFVMELEGEEHSFSARVLPIRKDGQDFGWSVQIRDTTQTVNLMNQLKNMATTDFLTGIYNRRHFMELAQRELELARRECLPASLVLFDLDHFKRINDTYGHQIGDVVLSAMAATIRNQLRKYDIFARYGGEEFVIFSVGMTVDAATRFAKRLCSAAAELEIPAGDQVLRITASFGVVELPPGSNLEDATAAADKAMYQAKENGRNRVEVGHVAYRHVNTPVQ